MSDDSLRGKKIAFLVSQRNADNGNLVSPAELLGLRVREITHIAGFSTTG